MKARKLLATILALAMTLSMLSVGALAAETEDEKNGVMPIAETEQTAPVSTLPADAAASWAAGSIERWTNNKIVQGDGAGNFNPDKPLSRGELATIFVKMFGLTEKAENTFGDLKGTEWYADAILKCVAAGIMKGDGVNANAEANITRAETIVMFGRAVGVTPDAKPDLSKFSDADSVADWAAGYMAPLTKMGILSGSGDGTINAGGQIDRASTMALLDKSVAEYVNAPGEYKVDNTNGFVIVNVAAKEGEVVISGTAAGVAVSAGTAEGKVVAKDLKADTIKVDGTAAVSVEGKSAVGEVVANNTGAITVAKGVTVDTVTANAASTITNNGTIKELTANAPAKVDNQGTITKAEVKADGVVLDGKKPTEVKVEEGTKNPTDSKGNEIKPVTPPTGGGSTGGGDTTTTVSGVVGVRPVDKTTPDPITDMPTITANATQINGAGDITVRLSSSKAVPLHKNTPLVLGNWVGVGIKVPADVTTADGIKFYFGATASDTAVSTGLTFTADDPAVGTGNYLVFFINAGDVAPKTFINIDWKGDGTIQKYLVNLSGVTTDAKNIASSAASQTTFPAGVVSTTTGLSQDVSAELTTPKALTQAEVATFSGQGGQYVTYYSIPKADIPAAGFTTIISTVNNGTPVVWECPSDTGATEGGGWWTVDANNYYFKIGNTFATKTNGVYTMKDNGVFNHEVQFVIKNGAFETVVATLTFKVDMTTMGYSIVAPAEVSASVQTHNWVDNSVPGIARDKAHEIDLTASITKSQSDITTMGGQFVEYVTLTDAPEGIATIIRTVVIPGVAVNGTETLTVSELTNDSRYAVADGKTYLKFGTTFAVKDDNENWIKKGTGDYTETLNFQNASGVAIGSCTYTVAASKITVGAPASYEVTFNTNGGSAISKVNVVNNGKITKPADPTRTGYSFVGWYKDAELTTEWNFGTDKVTAATTIYAKWASAAEITIMTQDTLEEGYIGKGDLWKGVPTTIGAFGAPTVTAGDDNTYEVAGTVDYVKGFVQHSGDAWYLPIQITVPADVAETGAIITRGENNGTLTLADLDTVNNETIYSLILVLTDERLADNYEGYPITVDWDGPNANGVQATTYTLDLSGVKKVVTEATPLTSTICDREGLYVTYTLKNGDTNFLIGMDTVTKIGKKVDDSIAMYKLWVTGEENPGGLNVEMIETAGESANHNNGWTLKTGNEEQTWYFWDTEGTVYSFTITPSAPVVD